MSSNAPPGLGTLRVHTAGHRSRGLPAGPVRLCSRRMKVTAEDVQNWISRGEPVVLLDSARPDVYVVTGKGTAGVRRLRPEEVASLQTALPKETRFIAYASHAADDAPANLLANMLRQQGYPSVDTLAGGSEGWRRLGLTVHVDGSVRFPSVW